MILKKPYQITEIIKETADVTIFKFKAVDGYKLDFEPGMFVMLGYKDPQTGQETSRAYSIASPPGHDTLTFAISMVHGRFTSKLDNAKVGDTYFISGPYGQFKFDYKSDKKVLFIAGGTGVAPFLSMIEHSFENNLDIDIVLVYSVRYPNDIIAKNRLYELQSKMKLKVVVTVTRESELPWDGERGHISADMIKKYVSDISERTCYICGPLQFTKAMKDIAVSLGFSNDKIKADVWG